MEVGKAVPSGASDVALEWVRSVLADDFAGMWLLTDPLLRLCFAQGWLVELSPPYPPGKEREEVAASLAEQESSHGFRPVFEQDVLAAARREYVPTWPSDRWGIGSNRRLVGEDLDVVLVVDTASVPPGPFTEEIVLAPGTVQLYLTRFSPEGWRVTGFDYQLPVPGWPPTSGVRTEGEPGG